MDYGLSSISRANLHIAIHAGHKEEKAVKGCEQATHIFAVFDVHVDRIRYGSGPEVCYQPSIALRGCLGDGGGRQYCDGGCTERRE